MSREETIPTEGTGMDDRAVAISSVAVRDSRLSLGVLAFLLAARRGEDFTIESIVAAGKQAS
jgi:hypothetical protein